MTTLDELIKYIKQIGAIVPRIHSEAGDWSVDDDVDLGYKIGDMWINTADSGVFICTDNTDGAAVWKEITFV